MNAIAAGAMLTASRKGSGISQHEMSKIIGCCQVRVSQYEQNPGSLSLEKLSAWHGAVNTDGKALVEKMVSDFFMAST